MSGPTKEHEDAQFFAARGFGQRIGFGARPTLLVIDMMNAFTDPNQPLGASQEAEIQAQNKLIGAARAKNVPVMFTTVAYQDKDLRDAGIWALKQKGVTSLMAGTPGVEIDRRLDLHDDDAIIAKKFASSFFATDLVSRLMAHGIDTLLITGCTTSGCVRATAVDACQYGFRPMVVRQAVADRAPAAHDQSLFDLDAKYADVVELDECLDYLAGLAGLAGGR